MKKFLSILMAAASVSLTANIVNDIPEINTDTLIGYELVEDVAQWGGADWSHAIGIARNISREKAKKIADMDSEITFFFYTKGIQMVLNNSEGSRVFRHGDTVFFSGEPHWGTAPGLADGYIKQ